MDSSGVVEPEISLLNSITINCLHFLNSIAAEWLSVFHTMSQFREAHRVSAVGNMSTDNRVFQVPFQLSGLMVLKQIFLQTATSSKHDL